MTTKYKTDKDIAAEFDNFIILEVTHDHTGSSGARSGYLTILWSNAGESVGGGIKKGGTTTDSYIDYDGDCKKIAFDSWYPEKTYNLLKKAVIAKLSLVL